MTKWFFEYLFSCRDRGDDRPMLAIFNEWKAAQVSADARRFMRGIS